MGRRVTLSAVNSQLGIATAGITISVVDDAPERTGRLRIGKAKIVWTPKFKKRGRGGEKAKSWDELIDFFMT